MLDLSIQSNILNEGSNIKKELEDTHIEKAPSNESPALTKIMNMDITVVGTSNEAFIGS